MTTATMTSKGQITIPKEIRDSLLLHNGDKIDFRVTDQGEMILRPLTRRAADVFGRLHKSGQARRSTEDMDAAIRTRIKSARP